MAESNVAQPTSILHAAVPYTPSWYDRLTDWIDGLPIPTSGFYLILAAILLVIHFAVRWDGTAGMQHLFPLVHTVTVVYALAVMHILDKIAMRALERFRPLLPSDAESYSVLRYRLTTLASRPVLVSTLIGLGYGIFAVTRLPLVVRVQDLYLGEESLAFHFDNAMTLAISALVGVMVYHTIHQLRIVHRIYNLDLRIDLYELPPLYAFSALSAGTAISITFAAFVWYQLAPQLVNIGSSVVGMASLTVFSMLTFALPLWGAHRLLVAEKERRLSENGKRQRAAFAELHESMDARKLADMDQLNKLLESLELEHTILERVSTWPWHKETFRAVAAALVFPVIVWVTQWVLGRFLGP